MRTDPQIRQLRQLNRCLWGLQSCGLYIHAYIIANSAVQTTTNLVLRRRTAENIYTGARTQIIQHTHIYRERARKYAARRATGECTYSGLAHPGPSILVQAHLSSASLIPEFPADTKSKMPRPSHGRTPRAITRCQHPHLHRRQSPPAGAAAPAPPRSPPPTRPRERAPGFVAARG